MNITQIIIPTLLLGGIGLILGLVLGIAAKVFGVEKDEKEAQVRELLPGVNCGGCGYVGCDALAQAIASGEAAPTACPVASSEMKQEIAKVMGVATVIKEREVAYVKCNGTCEAAHDKYDYDGIETCRQAALVTGGGAKACSYGCLGFGDCIKACKFDAISIIDGIAVIDEDKCTSCTKCVITCPKTLIEMVPAASPVRVRCFSSDGPKQSKQNCANACIACRICEKVCPSDAIHVNDNLSKVSYEKCIACNKCVEKCPTKCIHTY